MQRVDRELSSELEKSPIDPGASDSGLNVIQRFLDRCHKRHFTSLRVSVFDLLEQQD